MKSAIKQYLSQIGRKGGQKSRRQLSPQTARNMVKIREAKRAFRNFYTQCFWSFDEDYTIQETDIPWVVEQLRKHGNHQAWKVAQLLCR